MPSKTPTDEIRAVDVYDLAEIQERISDVASKLRKLDLEEIVNVALTLDKLAGKLEELAQNLEPPDLHEVLAEIDASYTTVRPRYFAERLTVGIELVTELMADAEITGSFDVYERAKKWLEGMGILTE